MKETLIDAHSHIHFPQFDADRSDVLRRMREAHVSAIAVGCDSKTSLGAAALANTEADVWATVGIHPSDNRKEIFDKVFFQRLAREPRVVAIGECGLDFYRTPPEMRVEEEKRQRDLFVRHIELALSVGKPLMIHSRPQSGTMDAYEKIIEILSPYIKAEGKRVRGNVHFFVGSEKIARQFVDWGFTLSFTGVITFARDYDDVVKKIPLENILTETDCPYVAPISHRGERNEPSYVAEVVQKLADLKEVSREEMARSIAKAAQRIFVLP